MISNQIQKVHLRYCLGGFHEDVDIARKDWYQSIFWNWPPEENDIVIGLIFWKDAIGGSRIGYHVDCRIFTWPLYC